MNRQSLTIDALKAGSCVYVRSKPLNINIGNGRKRYTIGFGHDGSSFEPLCSVAAGARTLAATPHYIPKLQEVAI